MKIINNVVVDNNEMAIFRNKLSKSDKKVNLNKGKSRKNIIEKFQLIFQLPNYESVHFIENESRPDGPRKAKWV